MVIVYWVTLATCLSPITLITAMLSLTCNEKTTCGKCGTQIRKLNLARHKKGCSAGTLYCTHCPNFAKKSQNDLNHHIAKNTVPKTCRSLKMNTLLFRVSRVHALRQHKKTQYGFPIKATNVELDDINSEIYDSNLREELRSSQPFLVDSELERARHKVFNYAVKSFNKAIVNEELDHFFNIWKLAVKVNSAFMLILKKIDNWGSRYVYAQENNTLLDWSKIVCTEENVAKLKEILNKSDDIESSSWRKLNINWRFYKLTNSTVFAALRKDKPMVCKDAVSPKSLLKSHTVNCLTYAENTRKPYRDNFCLFRAPALELHGIRRLEGETSENFNLFMSRMDGLRPS